MRLFTGLLIAALCAAPVAAVAEVSGYDLAPAPVASRGQVVEAGGVKTFTAENGWYTVTLGADGTTQTGDHVRYVTYGRDVPGHYVDLSLVSNGLTEGEVALGLDAIEGGMGGMLNSGYVPSFLQGKPISARKVMTLGDGNGRKPMQLMLWVSPGEKTVTLVAATMLPKGNLMILIDADNAVEAETVLREHFRIGEGVVE